MNSPQILYKLPSRERPQKPCIDNIISLARHDNYEILLTLDLDDKTCTSEEFKKQLSKYEKVFAVWGTSEGKIHAINRDMWLARTWDIGIVMADDMVWQVEGFDLEIIKIFEECFPDLDGLVHIPDGTVNERLNTLCIMGRKLYDYFGWFYNPIYWSVACDNEQFDVVRILGKYVYRALPLVRHMHPIWNLAPMDALYLRNESAEAYAKDVQIYRERKDRNFDLPA